MTMNEPGPLCPRCKGICEVQSSRLESDVDIWCPACRWEYVKPEPRPVALDSISVNAPAEPIVDLDWIDDVLKKDDPDG